MSQHPQTPVMSLERELKRCYERAREQLGDGAEPFSVVETGEKHREYWRPEKVRVLLLAESHIYTKADECVPMQGASRFGPSGVPERFIRLVYCLGLGEPEYLGFDIANNTSAWQFWLILSSCANGPDSEQFRFVLKGRTGAFRSRLAAKIDVLQRLRQMGVWLIDASVVALYTSGGGRPHPRVCERVLQTCWDEYIARVVSSAAPRQVIVIGQGVAAALSGRLDSLTRGEHKTINLPQGLRSAEAIAEAYASYYTVCREQCGTADV